LIGIVGLNKESSDLAVFDRPKSALSESFRARSSPILYKQQNLDGAKNANDHLFSKWGREHLRYKHCYVFALSEKKDGCIRIGSKKTKVVLLCEFNLSNEVGIVNYLIKQKNDRGNNKPYAHTVSDVILLEGITKNAQRQKMINFLVTVRNAIKHPQP
jgi:hypothetical protein